MAAIQIERPPTQRPLKAPPAPIEDWGAAGWAGVYGGCVYLFVQMVGAPVLIGASPWTSMRLIAAMVLGRAVLPPPYSFDPLLFIVAFTVNFTLSMIYARALATAWSRTTPRGALAVGLVAGCLLYVVNFYGFAGAFPWFAVEREWVTLLANALFGVTAAVVYKTLERAPEDR